MYFCPCVVPMNLGHDEMWVFKEPVKYWIRLVVISRISYEYGFWKWVYLQSKLERLFFTALSSSIWWLNGFSCILCRRFKGVEEDIGDRVGSLTGGWGCWRGPRDQQANTNRMPMKISMTKNREWTTTAY